MKRLLLLAALLLLWASGVSAQPVDNCSAWRVDLANIHIRCNVISASNTYTRLAWGTTAGVSNLTAYVNWNEGGASGSGTRRFVASGFPANTTIYLQPQTCISSCATPANWDDTYDANADSGVDTSEDTAFGSDSLTIEADGTFSFTTPNPADPFATTQPTLTEIGNPRNLSIVGDFATVAANGSIADLNTAYNNCRNNAADGSGDYDDIVVNWRFDAAGNMTRYFAWTNPDGCRIRSSRSDTLWCAEPGYNVDPLFDDWCLPNLRHNSYASDGFFNLSANGNVVWESVQFDTPEPGSGHESDGGLVTTLTRIDADTVEIDIDVAHQVPSSGADPNYVRLFDCAISGNHTQTTWNTTHDFTYVDTDTLRLTTTGLGDATFPDVNTCRLTHDQQVQQPWVFHSSGNGTSGISHAVFMLRHPWRMQSLYRAPVNGSGEGYVIDSFVPWLGSDFGYDPGTTNIDCGTVSGPCGFSAASSTGFVAEGMEEAYFSNVHVIGQSLASVFSDVFNGQGLNFSLEYFTQWTPDYRWNFLDDGSDGIGGVTVTGARHSCIELKSNLYVLINGLTCLGAATAADAEFTEPIAVYLRSSSGNDPDRTWHATLKNIWLRDHSIGFGLEGCRVGHNSLAECLAPVDVQNVALIEPRVRNETGYDPDWDEAGALFQFLYGQHARIRNFLLYTSDDMGGNWGPFVCFVCQGNIAIEDGIIPVFGNEADGAAELWWDQSSFGLIRQSPDINTVATGGELALNATRPVANLSTFTDIIGYGWMQNPGGSPSDSSDATAVTEGEMENEDDDTYWANMTYIGVVGETLTDRLNELALDSEFRRTGSTPGVGGEGLDVDEMHDRNGVLAPCAGNTEVWKATSTGVGQASFCTHVPSGSTRECSVKVWGTGWNVVTDATNGLDFAAAGDTITRSDAGGSWLEDGFYSTNGAHTSLVEIWG